MSRGPVLLVATALALMVAFVVYLIGSRIDDGVTEVHAEATPAPARALHDTTTTTQAPTTTTTAPKRTKAGAVYPTDALLYELAMCETGGTMDPATNTGNGFYGAFQFDTGTWWEVGGEGYAHEHPYEVQRDLARTLILRAGWGRFPKCSRLIGAR